MPAAEAAAERGAAAAAAVAEGDAWAVLIVGGTPGETFGNDKRPWPDPGQQVSFLHTLGDVYARLSQRLGHDRIIVIAGLQFVLGWLDDAAARGYPDSPPEHRERCAKHYKADTPEGAAKRSAEYRERAARVRHSCAQLLDRGGADYDMDRVTPDAVLAVLSGVPLRPGDRVLPRSARSVFLWVTTHGGHQAVSTGAQPSDKEDAYDGLGPVEMDPQLRPCDVCGRPHELRAGQDHDEVYDHPHSSLSTREWFLLMPRRSASAAQYDIVTTAGRNMDPHSHPGKWSPLCSVYAQQLFRCLAQGQQAAPGRVFVALYQFCTSGGHFKWLQTPSYGRSFGVDSWPFFVMSTSGELQFSLGGTFTAAYLDCMSRALDGRREETLDDLWRQAEEQYWREHQLEADMNRQQQSPGQRFGEPTRQIGRESGVGGVPARRVFSNDARAAPAAAAPKRRRSLEGENTGPDCYAGC
eukprot:TRINITY_DN16913_c0_g1_i1.p1 TRINITY_DN16913_c0_g1~~TRINITY_DN16913_c0_g1_i1.p1  ORF type:complete len:490 (+),score=113.03 TRINITY_DN16913_c0_g1_i1:72-1472(+)